MTAAGPYERVLGGYISSTGGSCSSAGNWQCDGPFTGYYGATGAYVLHQGRVNALWVDPADSNNIIAGTDGGGI